MHTFSNFVQGGVPAQLAQQPLIHHAVVLDSLTHLLSQAGGSGLTQDGTGHILADPPIPAVLKIPPGKADGPLPQAQAALLDQIQQQHTVARVLPCQLHHAAQTEVHDPGPQALVAAVLRQLL